MLHDCELWDADRDPDRGKHSERGGWEVLGGGRIHVDMLFDELRVLCLGEGTGGRLEGGGKVLK